MAHVQQFIDCIRTRKEPSATIEMGEVAQFPCMAANIAYRVGRRLYIEPDKREFYQDPEFKKPDEEANKLRVRQFRAVRRPECVRKKLSVISCQSTARSGLLFFI